jgi:hypothetical protein
MHFISTLLIFLESTGYKTMRQIFISIFIVCLCAGCGVDESNPPLTSEQIQVLELASVIPIKPQGELSEMFAFGSKHTDLQRENMSRKLMGSTVKWELPVYEVSLSNGIYRVQTKGDVRVGNHGSDLLTTIVFITARNDTDRRIMEALKTDDLISFKGVISEIAFRSYVIIEPAILYIPPLPLTNNLDGKQ